MYDPGMSELVEHGRIDVEGRLVDASNATLFGTITLDETSAHCVYKPVRGERPLWDFPDGTLAGREVATYLISEAGGWGLVPPTVFRSGPFGDGMVQLWVGDRQDEDEPGDPAQRDAEHGEPGHGDDDRGVADRGDAGNRNDQHGDNEHAERTELVDVLDPADVPDGWRAVLRAQDRFGDPVVLAHADHPGVRRMAAFDVVVNNADRKGGHVLLGSDGQVYGVDHGICLHSEPKLRTVLWGWAGEPLPADAVEALRKLRAELDGELSAQLAAHITPEEVRAVTERTDLLLAEGTFPPPSEDWRAIPWPPF